MIRHFNDDVYIRCWASFSMARRVNEAAQEGSGRFKRNPPRLLLAVSRVCQTDSHARLRTAVQRMSIFTRS